jgi:hypothetical protein
MKRIALILAATLLVGCRSISYTDKAGNSLKINSFVWDSSIGSLSASNGVDSVTLTNYASSPDQQALQLMDDVVKAGIVALPKGPNPVRNK